MPREYVPYRDDWPRYDVPARGLDAEEGRLWSDLRADELTDKDIAAMPASVREQVYADLAEMDRRDAAASVRRTDPPVEMAAECAMGAE